MATSGNGLLQLQPDEQFTQLSGQNTRNGTANISLPAVDAEKLKARLYSYAPQKAQVHPGALRFIRPTQAQAKKAAVPSAPRLEPLVCQLLKFVGGFEECFWKGLNYIITDSCETEQCGGTIGHLVIEFLFTARPPELSRKKSTRVHSAEGTRKAWAGWGISSWRNVQKEAEKSWISWTVGKTSIFIATPRFARGFKIQTGSYDWLAPRNAFTEKKLFVHWLWMCHHSIYVNFYPVEGLGSFASQYSVSMPAAISINAQHYTFTKQMHSLQELLSGSARVKAVAPKDAWGPKTPRGKTHTAAASVPPSSQIGCNEHLSFSASHSNSVSSLQQWDQNVQLSVWPN